MWLMFFCCPPLQTGVRGERREVRNQLRLGTGERRGSGLSSASTVALRGD